MGACRGLSATIGAAAAAKDYARWGEGSGIVPAFIVGLALYIAAVTALAARETRGGRIGPRRFLPAAAMLAWIAGITAAAFLAPLAWPPFAVTAILAWGWTLACARGLGGEKDPRQVQRTVGALIRAVLLVQACAAALMAAFWPMGWVVFALLLAFWPLSACLGRRFHAS